MFDLRMLAKIYVDPMVKIIRVPTFNKNLMKISIT